MNYWNWEYEIWYENIKNLPKNYIKGVNIYKYADGIILFKINILQQTSSLGTTSYFSH